MSHRSILFALLAAGCSGTVSPSMSTDDGGADVATSTADVAVRDVVLADAATADASTPDAITPDVSTADAITVDTPDVSLDDAGAVEPVEGIEGGDYTVRASQLCGLSVAWLDSGHPVALYAAQQGATWALRYVELAADRGAATRTHTLLTSPTPLCVGRRSLLRFLAEDVSTRVAVAWFNGRNNVGLALLTPDGTQLSRGATSATAGAAQHLLDDDLSLEQAGYRGAVLTFVADSRSGHAVHRTLFDVDERSITERSDTLYELSARDSVLLTRDGVVLSSPSGVAVLGFGTSAFTAPRGIAGLEAGAHAVSATSELPSSIRLASGSRAVSVWAASEGSEPARLVAADTAWIDTDALAVTFNQSPRGGAGTLWASHDRAGTNGSLLWQPDDSTDRCVVYHSPVEGVTLRSIAYAQVGARSKVVGFIARRATGATATDTLHLRVLPDGAGPCP